MQIITDIPKSLLSLPDTAEGMMFKGPKDQLTRANLSALRPQQLMAFTLMRDYVMADEPPYEMVLLEGYAGTGKTFTLAELIKELVLVGLKTIAITAPTNKAVKVIKNATKFSHPSIMYKTIHSLLGLKEVIVNEKTGERGFVPDTDPENRPKIHEVDVLIVDETSMLPDVLFKHIQDVRQQKDLRVIFVGDPMQIPPVNESDCIPFVPKRRLDYDIYRVALTEIVRQAKGNPILELATLTRENILKSDIPYNYVTTHNGSGGIVMINAVDKSLLYELCNVYFGSSQFAIDPDFCKVIAWTNVVADFMNNKIRLMLYKDFVREVIVNDIPTPTVDKIMIGEKLIADEPIVQEVNNNNFFKANKRDKRIVFTTNDEFEVISYKLEQVNVFQNYNVPIYKTKVRMVDAEGVARVEEIDIVHETGEPIFNQVLQHMHKKAVEAQDRAVWRQYYNVKNKFAAVKYNYAITAHKSQGSTYENAIVIEANIHGNPKVEERNRIKYVAYTRAKTNLFIVK